MKKYKIIKTYPGSDKLGTVITLNKKGECWSTPQLVIESDCKNNPEFFEEIIQKDYEILNWYDRMMKSVINYENCYSNIHSIRRLSDNEVFSIGDNVDWQSHKNHYKITEIKLFNEIPIIVLSSKDDSGQLCSSLSSITKSKPVLFVTEDGKKIFEGDNFWSVYLPGYTGTYPAWSIKERNQQPQLRIGLESPFVKRFSSENKAQEWIVLNKPCLSINDVLNAGYGICNATCLKELVKSRI